MKTILTLAALLALALNVSAQQKPGAAKRPAKTPARPAAAVVSTGTAAALDARKKDEARTAEIMEKLRAWDAKLETLSAGFTQEVNFREAGLTQSIEGRLNYARPNLIRIEHMKPSRQLVVTDKTDIWIYKPEDKQAVRTSWEAWSKTQGQNLSGILDFGNYAALAARNNVRTRGGSNGEPLKAIFTPRSGDAYTLTLTLSATDYFPSEAELEVDSTVIKTRLNSVEKNGQVDKSIFKFSPPKGVEVLELKN